MNPGCREVLDRLAPYVDGEIPLSEADPIRRHVEVCEPCARRVQGEAEFVRVLREMEYDPAPPGLATRIRAGLDARERRESRSLRWVLDRMLTRPVLGAAAAGLLVTVLFLSLRAPGSARGTPAGGPVPAATDVAPVRLYGTLVCPECLAAGAPIEDQRRCRLFGHTTGLQTAEGQLLRFLEPLEGDPEMRELLSSPARRGASVQVEGRIFRDIGYIHVTRVSTI